MIKRVSAFAFVALGFIAISTPRAEAGVLPGVPNTHLFCVGVQQADRGICLLPQGQPLINQVR